MSVRLTIERPRLDGAGAQVLDSEGKPILDPVVVDRRCRLAIGDQFVDEDWDWDELPFTEAVALEATFGGTLVEFRAALIRGSQTACQVLAWVLLRRENAKLRVAEVTLPIGALKTEIIDTDVATGEDAPADPETVERAGPTEVATDAPGSPSSGGPTSGTSPSTSGSDPGSGD